MKNFYIVLKGLILMAVLLSCKEKDTRPNVIIFFSDDMRTADISLYGENLPTPAIQKLSDNGALFNNAYCSSSMCTPSRYTLMTGNYAGRCQAKEFMEENPKTEPYTIAWNTYLSEKDKTIAEYLNEAGYFTGFVGKYHLGGDRDLLSFPHFDEDVDPYSDAVDSKLRTYQSKLQDYVKKVGGFDYAAGVLFENYEQNPIPKHSYHNFEWMTKGAIDFLDRAGEEPFFLYTATTALHGPSHLGALDLDVHLTPGGIMEDPGDYHPSRTELKQRLTDRGFELNGRNAGLSMLDDHVAAVLKKLDEMGESDNTMVIFLADHGKEPGKASCYEVGLKVPMAVRWPAVIEPNSVIDQNTQIVDLLPTVLEAAGSPLAESTVDGISFIDALHGLEGQGRKYLYSENGYSRAVSDGTYKFMTLRYPESVIDEMKAGKHDYAPNHLNVPMQGNAQVAIIYHPHYFDQNQLYNYVEDYWEQNNLIADDRYNAKISELKDQLSLQLQKFDHPYPLEKQEYLETEEFEKLTRKTYELGTDFIYWFSPEGYDLPPGY